MLEQDPTDWCAHNNRGLIFKERGELFKAQEAYNLAIRHGPPPPTITRENMAVVLTDMGSHLKLAGNVELALDRYNEALEYNPVCHS
jgi:protein O-GlcNAc transferase